MTWTPIARMLRATQMPLLIVTLAVLAMTFAAFSEVAGQVGVERLATTVFDVVPPSARVRGLPGRMSIQQRPCRVLPLRDTRRRLVDVAVQEWAFFGFRVVDRTEASEAPTLPREAFGANGGLLELPGGRRRSRLPPEEAARVAASIAGYWSVTPEGSWIVARQNEEWNGLDGITARWNAPWSAAFISWVMCEGGLGATNQFQRAIAHHAYIDQAIRARDGRAPEAAFTAYDTGETAITPGDLLCSSRRPVYRTIGERRRHTGVGARSHCDVVVKVDEASERILVIGGNVRGVVSLKLLRAQRDAGRPLRVVDPDEDSRPIFGHLKLRAEPIDANPLDTSPTVKAIGCAVTGPLRAAVCGSRSTVPGKRDPAED